MNISDNLRAQAERFHRTQSFNLSNQEKQDLATWYRSKFSKSLNIKCGTCIRNGMRDLVADMNISEPAIKLKPNITFIGVKQRTLEEMSYRELKDMAKAQGIIGNLKREKLIEELTNG
jgi:hypothetical protein